MSQWCPRTAVMALTRLLIQRNWRLGGECRNRGFAIVHVPAPRRKSASPAYVLAAMCALNGGHPSWRIGSKKNVTSLFPLTCLSLSTIMIAMNHQKNPNAQALGSLGGKARAKSLSDAEIAKIASKGGKARAAKLSAAELSRIAKLAVAARERKRKGKR